jgi:hypothetical protein
MTTQQLFCLARCDICTPAVPPTFEDTHRAPGATKLAFESGDASVGLRTQHTGCNFDLKKKKGRYLCVFVTLSAIVMLRISEMEDLPWEDQSMQGIEGREKLRAKLRYTPWCGGLPRCPCGGQNEAVLQVPVRKI